MLLILATNAGASTPEAPTWFALLFAGSFLLIGGVLLLIGVFTLLQERKRKLVQAEGEVTHVEVVIGSDSDGTTSRTYRPTFRFDTPGGTVERSTGSESSSNWNYPVGRTLTIAYDPNDESCVRPAGWVHRWLAFILFTLIGAGATGVGLLALISTLTR